jgi:hypothetical protein
LFFRYLPLTQDTVFSSLCLDQLSGVQIIGVSVNPDERVVKCVTQSQMVNPALQEAFGPSDNDFDLPFEDLSQSRRRRDECED